MMLLARSLLVENSNLNNKFENVKRIIKKTYARVSKKKRSWKRQGVYMVLVAVVAAPSSYYLLNRFSFGIDSQNYPCIPEYRVYLIDKGDKTITKGKTFAFNSQYIKGIGIKFVDGIANDRVSVNSEETTINDSMVGEGLLLAKEAGHTEKKLTRTGVIPTGYLWMMGRTKVSFDSRYWGVISEKNIIGRAYPIW